MPDIGTSSAIAQQYWRAGVAHEAERQTFGMEFVSTDEDAPFVLMDDLTKNRGDVVKYKFSPTDDTKDGFRDSDTIEGNEEELEIVQSSLSIDYLALAFKQRGQMSQQRTNVDLKRAAMVKLANKWARRWDQCIFNQLCGYTPAMYKSDEGAENGNSAGDNYTRTGNNAITQYDSNHTYRITAHVTDETLDSTDAISFSVIDKVLEYATSKRHVTYPLTPASDGYFHLFISPRQMTTLKQSTTTGQWMDIQRALLEGSQPYSQSAFKRYFAGIYSNVKIHISDYVTYGVNSSNAYAKVSTVDRAVLVGANALRIAFGEGYAADDHLDWVEQVRDFKKWAIAADSVFGMDRVRYNLPTSSTKETYGAFLIPTYQA
jgi:hypothetical protein